MMGWEVQQLFYLGKYSEAIEVLQAQIDHHGNTSSETSGDTSDEISNTNDLSSATDIQQSDKAIYLLALIKAYQQKFDESLQILNHLEKSSENTTALRHFLETYDPKDREHSWYDDLGIDLEAFPINTYDVDLLIFLSFKFSNRLFWIDFSRTLDYLRMVISNIARQGRTYQELLLRHWMAFLTHLGCQRHEGIAILENSLDLLDQIEDLEFHFRYYGTYFDIMWYAGNNRKSLDIAIKLTDLAEKLRSSKLHLSAELQHALVAYSYGKFDKSKEVLDLVYPWALKNENWMFLYVTCRYLSFIYHYRSEYQQAKELILTHYDTLAEKDIFFGSGLLHPLIPLLLREGQIDIAEEYLDDLEVEELLHIPVVNIYHQYSRALIFSAKSRFTDKARAQQILTELRASNPEDELLIMVLILSTELYLEELAVYYDETILDEIGYNIDLLSERLDSLHSPHILLEVLMLQVKLFQLQMDMDAMERTLVEITELATKIGMTHYLKEVEKFRDDILEQYEQRKAVYSRLNPLLDDIRKNKLIDYINHARKQLEPEFE